MHKHFVNFASAKQQPPAWIGHYALAGLLTRCQRRFHILFSIFPDSLVEVGNNAGGEDTWLKGERTKAS